VRFEVDGPIGPPVYCHCSVCRRANGSAFACNASVARSAFRLLEGAALIREFESSPGKQRAFCSRCGSPIYATMADDASVIRIRLGTLDQDPGERPRAHIWVGSKAPWHEIADALPQFPESMRGKREDRLR
jgi:hypothetical protein